MEIIIGKTAGFCFGVANAVNKTIEKLNECNEIYCLGELVHNKQVIEEIQRKGLNVIDNIEQAKQNVIIRAHGAEKQIYNKAQNKGIRIIDLTCPKVLKIHKIAEEYSKKGYYILIIGKSTHPETIGTISYCGNNVCVIETEKDIQDALKSLHDSKIKKVIIIAQTTFSLDKFDKFADLIKEDLKNKNIELEVKRTICDATKLRQEETKEIASKVDMMIIIGGKHSSNTNKLYEISKIHCKNSLLIEDSEELVIEQIKKYNKIGVMAGAPQKSIDSVVEILNKLC